MPVYDEIFVLLHQMHDLYSMKNVDTSRLFDSINRYSSWLEDEKKIFFRKRSLNSEYIKDKLVFLSKTQRLNEIFRNEKLSAFVNEVLLERKIFNPVSMRLE